MSVRINARIDDELMARVERLCLLRGENLTEVVRYGLELACQAESQEVPDVLAAFAATGFLGGYDGPEDLSVDYKRQLGEMLAAKHG